MPINARQKGSQAERDVIKLLSLHFPGKFERRSLGIKGADVICSDEAFPFAVEVKNQKSVRALHLLIGNHQLDNWWQQAKEQAGRVNKRPLLVAKVERHWFVTEDNIGWSKFEYWCQLESKNQL